MDEDKIYEMKLHEQEAVGDIKSDTRHTWVTRVAGGWLYSMKTYKGNVSMCFVPFNNEFQEPPKRN